jgi:hypothetical protein
MGERTMTKPAAEKSYPNPHEDIAATADEVPELMRKALEHPRYVIQVGPTRQCKGCALERELRFGWCFRCIYGDRPPEEEGI